MIKVKRVCSLSARSIASVNACSASGEIAHADRASVGDQTYRCAPTGSGRVGPLRADHHEFSH